MKFPFWLLLVISNPDGVSINAITTFQTKAECVAAIRVIEKQFDKEKSDSFNRYPRRPTAICERVDKK